MFIRKHHLVWAPYGNKNTKKDGSAKGINNVIKVNYTDAKGKKKSMSHSVIDEQSTREVVQEILRLLNENKRDE